MMDTLESFNEASDLDDWKTVDDVVMGGRSSSRLRWDASEPDASEASEEPASWMRFEGTISLENNGGFCSARQREADRGVRGLEAVRLTVRGGDKRYKWTIRTADTPDSSSWRHPFETTSGDWQTIELPLADFELWRRGTHLSSERSPDPSKITSLGILISDEQAGDFRVDLAEIAGELESESTR